MIACVEEILGVKTLMYLSSEGLPERSGVFLRSFASLFMPKGVYRGEQMISFLGLSRKEHGFSVPYHDVAATAAEHGIFINHSQGLSKFINLGGVKTTKVSMLGKHGDYIDAVAARLSVLIAEQENAFQQKLRDEAASLAEEERAIKEIIKPIQQELLLSDAAPLSSSIVSEETLPTVSFDSFKDEILCLLQEVRDNVSELRQIARKANPLQARAQWFSASSIAEIFDLDFQESLKLVREIGEGLVRERDYSLDVRYGNAADGSPMFVSQRLGRHIVTVIERKHIKVKLGYCRP